MVGGAVIVGVPEDALVGVVVTLPEVGSREENAGAAPEVGAGDTEGLLVGESVAFFVGAGEIVGDNGVGAVVGEIVAVGLAVFLLILPMPILPIPMPIIPPFSVGGGATVGLPFLLFLFLPTIIPILGSLGKRIRIEGLGKNVDVDGLGKKVKDEGLGKEDESNVGADDDEGLAVLVVFPLLIFDFDFCDESLLLPFLLFFPSIPPTFFFRLISPLRLARSPYICLYLSPLLLLPNIDRMSAFFSIACFIPFIFVTSLIRALIP